MNRRQSKLPEEVIKQIALYTSSSYRETVERGYTCFSAAVPRDTIIATQRVLVDNAISLQELMSHVFRMIAEKNPVFVPILEYAVQNPVRGGDEYVIMNENSLYSLIEAARRQEEAENECDNTAHLDHGMDTSINAANLNFKTFKQDKFLQRRVADTIIDLKEKAARKRITSKG